MKRLLLTSMLLFTVAIAIATINPRLVSAHVPNKVFLAVFHPSDDRPVIGTAIFTPLTNEKCEASLLLYDGFSSSRHPNDYSFLICGSFNYHIYI